MNIFKRELRAGLKAFAFWVLGLFFLVFTGVAKFSGIAAGGADVTALFDSFPRIVLAVFGMAGLDVTHFGDYYAVLAQYTLLLGAVYAASLGHSAVARESCDRTYEFLFTKPRSRAWILRQKLLASVVFLTLFCALDFVFALAAAASLDLPDAMGGVLALFSLALWLISLVFFGLAAWFTAATNDTEKAARLGHMAVLLSFALGVAADMQEQPNALRLLSPFKYFSPAELLESRLNPYYLVLCLAIAALSLVLAFRHFEKRDLSAL